MKIIIELPDEEALRPVEDDEENILTTYEFIIRRIEQILGGRQIRYEEVYHTGEVK